jgi:hypothetical protein
VHVQVHDHGPPPPALRYTCRVRWLVLAIALLAAPASAQHRLPPGIQGWTEAGYPAIRGVTVGPIESSLQPGRGYGTAYTEALLDHLAAMGVNWVSVTPFGRVWDLRSTDVELEFEAPFDENRAGVARFVEQAHARGIRVLVIPHLWVDVPGLWRGEIELGSPERWAEFQASYRSFVLTWARAAADAGADGFSIGVECKSWSGRFGAFWSRFVAEVRAIFPGLLTYSANWDEVEDVLFWDQLDLVGVNAFYPLADHDGASYREYLEGARRAAEGVERTARVLDMPVLFVEVGYTTRVDAAVQPWLWPDDMTDVAYSESEQARALEASFSAFAPAEWFAGFFVWRYYANLDDVSQEAIWGFSPHAKSAGRLLPRVFASGLGADPVPYLPAPRELHDGLGLVRSTVVR